MIQTRGFISLVEAADVMLKTALVRLVGYEISGEALVTVIVRGQVADCRSAVDAGAAAAHKTGELVSASVIPYPFSSLEDNMPISLIESEE
jgi:microcompartment protein CcmL/EutN